MALSKTVLAGLIKSKVEAATGNAMPAISQTVWEAVADAIVTHVKQATVTVTVASVSGVTPGGGASGPGTGTAVIT